MTSKATTLPTKKYLKVSAQGEESSRPQEKKSSMEFVAKRKRGALSNLTGGLLLMAMLSCCHVEGWTGEIHGRVVCDVCGDSSIGPEDHPMEGAEVAVLCITKSGEVLNYQAFTNSRGIYTVAETMPESDRWDSCLARPISSYNVHCTRRGDAHSGVKFTYTRPSGYSHHIKPFLYKPVQVPAYCI
ncbi:uncharacterized protein M6B38_380900 [Iris pallida]|uniref:Pollen Ole e 1 allergen and extensin family protein n=1 Tax=Iris pallida TaxID=29817 RepID=A0AAX6G992_IRIPA|nr:uncharacterized protein M6B38_198550 [Iris pallida]KAJ6824937.1 uncharacterized protein M6B38_380900 [Iris pallida]